MARRSHPQDIVNIEPDFSAPIGVDAVSAYPENLPEETSETVSDQITKTPETVDALTTNAEYGPAKKPTETTDENPAEKPAEKFADLEILKEGDDEVRKFVDISTIPPKILETVMLAQERADIKKPVVVAVEGWDATRVRQFIRFVNKAGTAILLPPHVVKAERAVSKNGTNVISILVYRKRNRNSASE